MLKGKISAGQVIIPLTEKMSTQICATVAFKNNVKRSIRGRGRARRRGVGVGIYGTAEVFEARKYWGTTDRQRVNPIQVMDRGRAVFLAATLVTLSRVASLVSMFLFPILPRIASSFKW
jgi:hypothetical protein